MSEIRWMQRSSGSTSPVPASLTPPTETDLTSAPPSAGDDVRNDVSQRVLGKEHRFRYGAEGEVRLPKLSRDELKLDSSAAARLANTRVYLLPGTPWPGVAEQGTAWLEPWSRSLEQAGVGRVVPVRYTDSSAVVDNVKMLTEPLTHQQRDVAMERIEADLAAKPLKPGERIFLVGHSYGAPLAADVTTELQARGIPVRGYVAMEDRIPGPGQILHQAPAVPDVLEIENDPGKPLKTQPGTEYHRLVMPSLTHMDMVLTPPKSLMTALIREFAR